MSEKSLLVAALLFSCFVLQVVATDADDKYKAGGLPITLLATIAFAVFLTWKQLRDAQQASRLDMTHFFLFHGGLVATCLSLFLYFTPAWAFGLVCTLVCYLITLFTTASALNHNALTLNAVLVIWLFMLIGLPPRVTTGVFDVLSNPYCKGFYDTVSDTMCKEGWLTFAELIAGIMVGMTFLAVILTLASAVEAIEASRAAQQVESQIKPRSRSRGAYGTDPNVTPITPGYEQVA